MKSIIAVFLLLAGISTAQTTTGTVQRIGNFSYYSFQIMPAPNIYPVQSYYYQPFAFQSYQPVQVPLVDTFAPARQSVDRLVQAMAYKHAMDLEQQRINLERQRIQIEANKERSFQELLYMIDHPNGN